MSIQKARPNDVMGFLNMRPIAVAVRSLFGRPAERFLVNRYHAETYGVAPDTQSLSLPDLVRSILKEEGASA